MRTTRPGAGAHRASVGTAGRRRAHFSSRTVAGEAKTTASEPYKASGPTDAHPPRLGRACAPLPAHTQSQPQRSGSAIAAARGECAASVAATVSQTCKLVQPPPQQPARRRICATRTGFSLRSPTRRSRLTIALLRPHRSLSGPVCSHATASAAAFGAGTSAHAPRAAFALGHQSRPTLAVDSQGQPQPAGTGQQGQQAQLQGKARGRLDHALSHGRRLFGNAISNTYATVETDAVAHGSRSQAREQGQQRRAGRRHGCRKRRGCCHGTSSGWVPRPQFAANVQSLVPMEIGTRTTMVTISALAVETPFQMAVQVLMMSPKKPKGAGCSI